MISTYSLGFFLGPGLPLGLVILSTLRPMFRFVPGAGPLRFFGGSAGLEESCAGAGVELDSDIASVDSPTLSVGTFVVVAEGVGPSDAGVADSCFVGFGMKRASSSGGNLRTAILDVFFVLSILGVDIDGDLVRV